MDSSNTPTVLADIYKDDLNISIWPRTLSPSLIDSVESLLQNDTPLNVTQTVNPRSAQSEMQKLLPVTECTNELSENLAELVDMFCYLFDLKQAGLRLSTLDHAMCPRFHVDKVPCRLVTTFAGQNTEWLQNEHVDRSKLGAGNNGLPDEYSGIYQSTEDIQQLSIGDVALLKGESWENNSGYGLVHRSPPASVNEKRLLLTLDFDS